jgi:cysteine desulfurase
MTPSVYLDHNATTPLRPQAIEAMREAMHVAGNPSSVHRHGRLARRLVENARERVAKLVDADPANVVFTGSGTEANALALRGAGRRRVMVSAVEHASVLHALDDAEIIPVGGNGVVRLDALETRLAASDEPALISVMLANNETGVLQPVREIGAVARRHGALLHCDAVQAAGKVAVHFESLGAHLLSLSAHKLGGPAGVGALVVDPSVPLSALLRGGGQERGRRAGSENVLGIVGFGAAAEAAAGLCDSSRLATSGMGWSAESKQSLHRRGSSEPTPAGCRTRLAWRCPASVARRR